MNAVKVDDWNVAYLAGGLLLSADDFVLQLTADQTQNLFAVISSKQEGTLVDSEGNKVKAIPKDGSVILIRTDDKLYPGGIIVSASSLAKFNRVSEELRKNCARKIIREGHVKIQRK